MGVGDINRIKLVKILIITLLLLSIIDNFSSAAVPTVIKGRVFINNIKTKPDAVHLLIANEILNATLYEDGSYILVASNVMIGTIGYFSIIYHTISYTPAETVNFEKDVSLYEIDLYVSLSSNITEKPISNPGGPYFEGIGMPLQFDGTKSNDPDGTITNYEWNFGDTTIETGVTPTHIYQKEGNYTITLKVTDNEGNIDQASTYVLITEKKNYQPNAPRLTGLTQGTITLVYNLTIQATDNDNDTIQYIINWGDDKKAFTTTDFLPNGTLTIVTHQWMNPGVYTIRAFTKDRNNATSQTTELTVNVNVFYVNTIGYFIDTQNDGIYEEFFSNVTGNVSLVQQNNNIYLIDTDTDGIFDHQYNFLTEELNTYSTTEPIYNLFSSYTLILLAISFVFILGVIALMMGRKRTKQLLSKKTPEENMNHLSGPQQIDSVDITAVQVKEVIPRVDVAKGVESTVREDEQKVAETEGATAPIKEVEPRVDTAKGVEGELKKIDQMVELSKKTDEQVSEILQKIDEGKITDEKLKEIRKKIDELLEKK